MKIRQIAGALGAEMLDIDLSAPLTGAQIAEIRQALLDHCVIFFRDQTITPDQQVAFARAFGKIVDYPMIKPLPDDPEIMPFRATRLAPVLVCFALVLQVAPVVGGANRPIWAS